MKLARSLTEGEFDNCFILTFNADLPFFERMIFSHLYDNGCRNLVILMDPDHYVEELRDSIPILNHVGQRYICAPATKIAGLRFHPKLILQTGKTHGRLFLGSGNLSQPGLTRNWEVVTRLDYSTENPDSTALMAFRSLFRYLHRLSKSLGLSQLVRRRTDRLIASTPWVDPLDTESNWSPRFRVLDNLDQPLWGQVIAIVPAPVKQVRIVSPYFDPVCRVFRRLIEDLQPQSICLYIQPNHHNLDAQQLLAVVNDYQGRFEVRALDLGDRRLHAKAMLFETERGVWLLTGSANFSVAGLMKSARFGNAELSSLRHEANPRYFDTWWDALHRCSHPIEIDWEAPPDGEEPPDEHPPTKSSIVLSSATLDDSGLLDLRCVGKLTTDIQKVILEFSVATAVVWEPDNWKVEESTLSVVLSDRWRRHLEMPWLITLHLQTPAGRLSSLPVLVHHTGQLYRYSRPPPRPVRVPIPEGLGVEDETQLLDLMHLFQRLLVAKSSDFDRKLHKITVGRKPGKAPDEDELPYDPHAQVANEKVRPPDSATFYRNYYDQVTFRDLMRAALRASFQAPKELRPSTHRSQEPSSTQTPGKAPPSGPASKPSPKQPITADDQRARLIKDMDRGLQKLVRRFGESAGDRNHLSSTPPSYLSDFFCGIVQFMGVIQHTGLITASRYAHLATELLVAFYGIPGQKGIWQGLKQLHRPEILSEIESHTDIYIRSWVLLYQAWCLLNVLDLATEKERLRWQLGAVARRVVEEVGSKNQRRDLAAPLEEQAKRLWPEEADRPNFEDFETVLLNAAQHYHVDLLKEELKQVGARAVNVRLREGVHPDLHVTIPIRNLTTPDFLSAFQKFVSIHRTQPRIRAQFKEPSVVSGAQGRSVIFMYQQPEELLLYAVRYESTGSPIRFDPELELHQLRGGST